MKQLSLWDAVETSTTNTSEKLKALDIALSRMRTRGHQDTIYYDRLKAKRDALSQGKPYQVVSVTELLVTSVASLIPSINTNTRNKRIYRRSINQ